MSPSDSPTPPTQSPESVLLRRLDAGDSAAAEALVPLVYDALRALAGRAMSHQAPDHTLQPTALVNEAWIKIAPSPRTGWEGRRHFLAVAAKAMRSVLVDHANRRNAQKRPPGRGVALDRVLAMYEDSSFDVVELDEALRRLEQLDARKARVVELRYFGGCSVEETARVLDISPATVRRDWQDVGLWFRGRGRLS